MGKTNDVGTGRTTNPLDVVDSSAILDENKTLEDVQDQIAVRNWKRWSVLVGLGLLAAISIGCFGLLWMAGSGRIVLPDGVLIALASTIPVEVVGVISVIISGLWKT